MSKKFDRSSHILVPTLKEIPQDAEIPSHKLMLRAGLIRKLSSGLYTFLPLGLRSLRKIMEIIREELNEVGAQEVLMPAMQPADLWKKTGRYDSMKDVMYRFEDRQKREMVLGPTHEEVITELVAHEISSYRQLPANFYQIQTKFRDEIRPRFGLMRAREFMMKDAYSFDADQDGVKKSYAGMYKAYENIFARCGLETRVVEADTGAIGGSDSHEFMVVAEAGEDVILESSDGSYAANLEKAQGLSLFPREFEGAEKPIEEVSTPDQKTIQEVADFFQAEPCRLIKTLIYKLEEETVAVLVPGNRDVNELKLAKIVSGEDFELADDQTVMKVTGAPLGFAGPVGLKNVRIIADNSLARFRGGITGANKIDTHLINVDLERDAKVSSYEDVAFALEGDNAPNGNGLLKACRGIEVGHVFNLGTKYSEALNAVFLDQNGKKQTMIMGCYGIGVTRTLQSVIEQLHDDEGIVWPISVAPYEVHVLPLNVKSEASVEVAETLTHALADAGIEVLLDDRKERPGVKFKDSDLLGIPFRVAIGDRSLERGVLEVKARNADVVEIAVHDVAEYVIKAVEQAHQNLNPNKEG